jgi:hypothetical protein
VPAGASDPYVNIATVTANVGTVTTVNDTDNHSVNLFQPFIDVTKAHTGGTPVVGNTLTYLITITAGGSSSDTPDLVPVSIIDSKLGTLSISSFTESGINDNKLQVGETWTLSVNYVVLPTDGPSLTNVVSVHFRPMGFPNDLRDTASVTLTVDTPGGEGLTPGFWKNNAAKKGAVAWGPTGFSPNQTLESVFNVPNSLGMDNVTLLQALNFKGGGGVRGAAQSLFRAAVAAVLNASHPLVDYPMSLGDIIADVNAALATNNRGTMLSLKDELDALNNLGGGIDQHGNPT